MRQTFEDHADPSFGTLHLPLIREATARQGLDGFLIPHEDEHQNEYLPEANDRLAWATGFTGSAGAAVVLKDKVEGGVSGWLESVLKPGQVLGYDPHLHSPDALYRLRKAAERAGARLKPVAANPLDEAWGKALPEQPQAPVVPHPLDY